MLKPPNEAGEEKPKYDENSTIKQIINKESSEDYDCRNLAEQAIKAAGHKLRQSYK